MKNYILFVSMVLTLAIIFGLSPGPAFAKPYTITVVVKDSAKKPVENLSVHVVVKTGDPAQDTRMPLAGESLTDAKGNVEFAWTYDELYPYSSYTLWLNGTEYGTFELNKKQGGRTQIVYYDLGINVAISAYDFATVGETVTYTFAVTNTGSFPLANVTVEDSITGTAAYQSGDASADNLLDTTETWVFTDTWTVEASSDPLVDSATATGYYDTVKVTDTDTHSLKVATPGIQLVQTANLKLAQVGETVNYTFTVTNTGDAPLSTVTVYGDITEGAAYQSGDTNSDNNLDTTETWIFADNYTFAATGTKTNTATATGYLNATPVTDEDAYTLDVTAQGPAPSATLISPDNQSDGNFGFGLAAGSEHLFVGAPYENTASNDENGQVHIFDATTYAFDTTLTSPSPGPYGYGGFGGSFAVSGDYLVVNAFDEGYELEPDNLDTYIHGIGNAYIFTIPDWSAPAVRLITPTPCEYGYFGWSSATNGSRVFVGAYGEPAGGMSGAGQVHIFDMAGNHVHTLTQPTPTLNACFGEKVVVHGTKLYVGADVPRTVYIYDAETYEHLGTISNPDASGFGGSIAVDDQYIFIGADGESPAGEPAYSGRVHVYTTATYGFFTTMASPNPTLYGNFGTEIVTDGTTVVVSAPGEGEYSSAGKAYAYDAADLTAIPVILTSPNPEEYGYFGQEDSVAISGGKIIIGAQKENEAGYSDAGHVYVYDLTP